VNDRFTFYSYTSGIWYGKLIVAFQGTISYAENEEASSYKISATIHKATHLLKSQKATINIIGYLKGSIINLSLTDCLDITLLDVLIINSQANHLLQLQCD
jgi:hypothetical protein